MRLPNNEIGITDIRAWLECGRRWEFGMRRHVEGKDPPEAVHPDIAYGTVFHDMVERIEALDLDDDEALQAAFDQHATDLDPSYYARLKWDLRTYHERELTDVRTVCNEEEVRIPLMRWRCFECEDKDETIVETSDCPECGGSEEITIYFRGKIDRLYQSRANPGLFFHRDYKTSKHRKSKQEVHEDIQMWAYNWAIFEWWPECEELEQEYDQLRFGLETTRKTEQQREEIKEWMVRQVTAILKAPEAAPKLNQWCPWCPIKESCSEVDRLHQFETARINFLSKTMPEPGDDPEMEFLPTYIEKLPEVLDGIKLMKAFADSVKAVLKELPEDRREALGWKLTQKTTTSFSSESLRAMQEILGDELFFEIISASQTDVKGALKGDDETLETVMALASKQPGSQVLKAIEA